MRIDYKELKDFQFWRDDQCSICGEDKPIVVDFSDDFEIIHLCPECLHKLAEYMESKLKEGW